MPVTALQGIVQNGRVCLEPGVRLPEDTEVFVVVPGGEDRRVASLRSPRLADSSKLQDFTKRRVSKNPDADI